MLNCYKRIAFKRLQRKRIIRGAQCFCIENRIISFEKLLDNIQNCRFTCTGWTIQHHKLLQMLRISRYNGTNRPFNFMPFFFGIQSWDQFLVSIDIPLLQRIRKALTCIIFLICLCIREYQFFIQHSKRISLLSLTVFMPSINYSCFRIPHMKNSEMAIKSLTVFLCIVVKLTVDKVYYILLICRP